jgi:hypothetical protein
MTNEELAQKIIDRFTPFAFLCECGGEVDDCATGREYPSLIVQNDTVARIARYIKSLDE